MIKRSLILLGLLSALVGSAVMTGCRSAHTTSAILYIEQEQYQKAIDVINDGLYYNPNDPEAYYYQGEAYSRMAQQAIDRNDYRLAKRSFEDAYERYQRAKSMDPAGMTELVDEALEINYRNTLRDGQAMWREQHFEEAEGYFRLAFAALPDSLEPIRNIASMKIQQAELLPAQADSTKLLRSEALTLLERVLAQHADAYQLLADKAYVLTQLGRAEEADALYRNLLRDHRDDPSLLLDVVNLYQQQERYLEAADILLQVAEIYINDTDPATDAQLKGLYVDAGFNFRRAGELARAIDAYNLANEQDVYDVNILLEREQLFLLYGRELKERAASAAVAGDRALADDLDAQARTALQRGVDVGNALTSLAPTNADAFFFLASIQALLGDEAAFNQNMKTYEELSGIQ